MEQNNTNIEQLLENSRSGLHDIVQDPGFVTLCHKRGLKLEHARGFQYWRSVADYAYEKYKTLRENGGNKHYLVIAELTLTTPVLMYTQQFLDRHAHDHNNPAVIDAKELVSYYNGLVREAARSWPALKPSQLDDHMHSITAETVGDDEALDYVSYKIRSVIRGARSELGFEQLVDRTGRKSREATIDEDLHGIDRVILDSTGEPTHYIDVKASLSEIEHHRYYREQQEQRFSGQRYHHRPHHEHHRRHADHEHGHSRHNPALAYERTYDGHLIMYSPVSDDDFGDSFWVPAAILDDRAAELEETLRKTSHIF